MIRDYLEHAEQRGALGIPPKPLNADQAEALSKLLVNPGMDRAGLDYFM